MFHVIFLYQRLLSIISNGWYLMFQCSWDSLVRHCLYGVYGYFYKRIWRSVFRTFISSYFNRNLHNRLFYSFHEKRRVNHKLLLSIIASYLVVHFLYQVRAKLKIWVKILQRKELSSMIRSVGLWLQWPCLMYKYCTGPIILPLYTCLMYLRWEVLPWSGSRCLTADCCFIELAL